MRSFVLCLLLVGSFACKKNNSSVVTKVEIYLLNSYELIPGECRIEAQSAQLHDTAFIRNDDIIAYSDTEHMLTFVPPAFEKIKLLHDAQPFAMVAGGEVVYYGIFKPAFSSSTCDESITMDYVVASPNSVVLNLGYPVSETSSVDDQRNNLAILAAFKSQGKLK